jgi:hypothetical protein
MLSLSKISKIILYSLMSISVLFILLYGFGSIDEGMFLIWAYILVAIASVSAILFPVAYFIMNPSKAKTTMMGLGGFAIIAGISYLLSSSEIPTFLGSEEFNITESLSKNIGMGLIATYILSLLTIGAIIYSEISKYFK